MKKLICILCLAAVLMLTCSCVFAEETGLVVNAPADWADEEHQQASAVVFPAWTWGTGYTDELAVNIHWPESVDAATDYAMILTPQSAEAGKAVFSLVGDRIERAYAENGEVVNEDWQNDAVKGTATVTEENGNQVLTFETETAPELNMLHLQVVVMPSPSPEEIAEKVLQPLYALEDGTAGAEMKKAQLAADLIVYAVQNRFYAMDGAELKTSMVSALESMKWNDEEYEVYVGHEVDVTDLMLAISGLTDAEEGESELARATMADAGVLETIEKMLTSAVDRFSVEVLTGQLATIENVPGE